MLPLSSAPRMILPGVRDLARFRLTQTRTSTPTHVAVGVELLNPPEPAANLPRDHLNKSPPAISAAVA